MCLWYTPSNMYTQAWSFRHREVTIFAEVEEGVVDGEGLLSWQGLSCPTGLHFHFAIAQFGQCVLQIQQVNLHDGNVELNSWFNTSRTWLYNSLSSNISNLYMSTLYRIPRITWPNFLSRDKYGVWPFFCSCVNGRGINIIKVLQSLCKCSKYYVYCIVLLS